MNSTADKVLRDCERFIAAGDIDSARKCAVGLSILTGNPAWQRAYELILNHENPLDHVMVTQPHFPYGSEPANIAAALHALHDERGQEFPNQSVRGGTQVNLTHGPHFFRELLDDLGIGNTAGIWSTRLPNGGYHIPHIHPQGGRSHVLYVDVPDTFGGHLYFGVPRYLPRVILHKVVPKTGEMVSFPNWLWHGVTPYKGTKPRLTIAFDTVPHG